MRAGIGGSSKGSEGSPKRKGAVWERAEPPFVNDVDSGCGLGPRRYDVLSFEGVACVAFYAERIQIRISRVVHAVPLFMLVFAHHISAVVCRAGK
jgi:hypothetical protein